MLATNKEIHSREDVIKVAKAYFSHVCIRLVALTKRAASKGSPQPQNKYFVISGIRFNR